MQTIKCPKCGEAFTVDESGYAEILNQVKTKEFEKELKEREADLISKHEMDIQVAVEKALREKDEEIIKLREQNNSLIVKNNSEQERTIEITSYFEPVLSKSIQAKSSFIMLSQLDKYRLSESVKYKTSLPLYKRLMAAFISLKDTLVALAPNDKIALFIATKYLLIYAS